MTQDRIHRTVSTVSTAGVLVLEDGTEFIGMLFGALPSVDSIRKASRKKDFAYGEVVFNTSMSGYQEILTDPSYCGQIICMTVPHLGNTGINLEDLESKRVWCSGFILHQLSEQHSNWRSTGSLEDYLRTHDIPGLTGVDTRVLTLHLRSKGVLRGVILPLSEKSAAKGLLAELPKFEGRDLIAEVSTRESYKWSQWGTKQAPKTTHQVIAIDYGIKSNMLRILETLGCSIEVMPAHSTAAEILSKKPDGVFLSNGPGDPAAAHYAVETVRGLLGQVPIFGVCMGHQILALALGGKTYKLKFGHRGGNQPVIDLDTRKVEISSHNHGYAVDATSLPESIEVTHLNLNDKTVEGLRSKQFDAFSVQYHPEACPGPHDSLILFEKFIKKLCIKNTLNP